MTKGRKYIESTSTDKLDFHEYKHISYTTSVHVLFPVFTHFVVANNGRIKSKRSKDVVFFARMRGKIMIPTTEMKQLEFGLIN